MSDLDIEKWKLNNVRVQAPQKTQRFKPGEMFLKGPIPLAWLSQAAALPGKTLHVALALWFLKGLNKSATVHLTHTTLKHFSVKRQAGYRSLRALEQSGLVSCSRSPGRCPIVTIKLPVANLALPGGEPYEK